jgi:hypothetical protein
MIKYVLSIMIIFCFNCGFAEKEEKEISKIEEKKTEINIEISWKELHQQLLNIKYLGEDASLDIMFESKDILYSKSQFDKEYLYKGNWHIDENNGVIKFKICDGKGVFQDYLSGEFKSFDINRKEGIVHSIIFYKSKIFLKRNDFADYLGDSDYFILFVRPEGFKRQGVMLD